VLRLRPEFRVPLNPGYLLLYITQAAVDAFRNRRGANSRSALRKRMLLATSAIHPTVELKQFLSVAFSTSPVRGAGELRSFDFARFATLCGQIPREQSQPSKYQARARDESNGATAGTLSRVEFGLRRGPSGEHRAR
jgi:hypothetical protein